MDIVEFLLKLLEIPALLILIYVLLYVSSDFRNIILFTVFALLTITSSSWVLYNKNFKKALSLKGRKLLFQALLTGAVFLIIILIVLIFYNGGSNIV